MKTVLYVWTEGETKYQNKTKIKQTVALFSKILGDFTRKRAYALHTIQWNGTVVNGNCVRQNSRKITFISQITVVEKQLVGVRKRKTCDSHDNFMSSFDTMTKCVAATQGNFHSILDTRSQQR